MPENLEAQPRRRVPVIVNERSGSGHGTDTYTEIRRLFAQHGMQADIHAARSGEELQSCVHEALREHPGVVVAAGGDGTINAVASSLRGSNVALGILPLGTRNHFARDLGVPSGLEDAVAAIAKGAAVAVDMGEVNGRTFVNNASLGLYPHIVRNRKRLQERQGHRKYWAMLWATLKVVGRHPFMRLKLHLDGRTERWRTPFVFIGNNDYLMEGFQIGTRSSLRDAKLSVYTAQRRGRLSLLRLGLRALFGRLKQAEDFIMEEARNVRVESPRRLLLVATDGEVSALPTPLEFRVHPGALRVLLPKAA
jgi:YegS/Rv2252/BmrU family lipid kinase